MTFLYALAIIPRRSLNTPEVVMLHLKRHTWDELCRHAQDTFPEECCGAIVVNAAGEEEVRRITNVQNAMHAKDPQNYPRDATIAYFMDPKELLEIMKEVDSGRVTLKAFYHSHPNHDAYFSAEDKARALFADEPSYPDAAYLVISIYDRAVRVIRAYRWDEEQRDFVETSLSTAG
ncbi:MAG: M67 family metallopeptidase [Thermoleophilum sp.]|nr:M67 family metallopeptidase [Thermoleophilum sp.]